MKLIPVLLLCMLSASFAQTATWRFAVSGDSRNCGDVVMPTIAEGVSRNRAEFYWHLGDLRAIYDFDQDFKQLASGQPKPLSIIDYENQAWNDFIENQIAPFGTMAFFLGIGNHETTPPKTRADFLIQFADWLDSPVLREQRLKDDPKDHKLHTYYHWVERGIDFINLDNATHDQFDAEQMKWVEALLARDTGDPTIRTVIVGMHAALPDSISSGHSMNEWTEGAASGRRVYQDLLRLRNESHKKVYVLASHSHFFMDGIFNTDHWRTNGGVLPGWIVGTAGAVRYPLPPNHSDAKNYKEYVYGYLLATAGAEDGSVKFEFKQIDKNAVPNGVRDRFTSRFVDECFDGNPVR